MEEKEIIIICNDSNGIPIVKDHVKVGLGDPTPKMNTVARLSTEFEY